MNRDQPPLSPDLNTPSRKIQNENAEALATNRPMLGFMTANGKPVQISERALQNARKLFESIDAAAQSPSSSSDCRQGKKSFQEMEDGESQKVSGPAEKKVKLLDINTEEATLEKSMHQQELMESISALLADEELENGSEGDTWTGIGQEDKGTEEAGA